MSPRLASLAALTLGLLIALTANATYAVPRGPVTFGLGLVCPLVLPLVLYLRTTFTVDGRWQRFLRGLATLAVAGPAATVSYVHTYELVLGAGEPWLLAVLAPLSSDGLAGMATLALHRLRHPAPAVSRPARKPRPVRVPPTTDRPAPNLPNESGAVSVSPRLASVGGTSSRAARVRELVAEGVPRSTAYRRVASAD